MPRPMNEPDSISINGSGRWTPSKMLFNRPGPKLHRKRQARSKDGRAGPHPGSFFINLRGDNVTIQTDHLTHQVLIAHLHQLQHTHVT